MNTFPSSQPGVLYFNSRENPVLSNFYCSDRQLIFTHRGREIVFRCVETAYQIHKLQDPTYEQLVAFSQLSPYEARQAGRQLQLRPHWDLMKDDIMYDLLERKFARNPLRSYLKETRHFPELVHLSPWDRYWGMDHQHRGQNILGQMLMQIRSELAP